LIYRVLNCLLNYKKIDNQDNLLSFSQNNEIVNIRTLSNQSLLLAEKKLSSSDAVMAELIKRFGSCPLGCSEQMDGYSALASSIIGQQLSSKAAETIRARVIAAVGEFSPENILALEDKIFRNTGLSRPKIRYLQALSERVISGQLNFNKLTDLADDEVIDILTEVPGVGRWTAEMFLIFALNRPDVLSLGDAGLRRSTRMLYGKELHEVAEPWRPYRSVASWYLWKHIDS
jgi:DNA-3-methyladenine glycosylase II